VSRRRRASLLLAFGGAALAGALLVAARPAAILELLRRTSASGLLTALALTALVAACRGGRLALLVGPPLAPGRAVAITAVSQMAIALLPLRLGELAALPLLAQAGISGNVRILSFLLTTRLLDIVALLLWALVAAALVGARELVLALPLAAVPILALVGAAVGQRWLRRHASPWRHAGGRRRAVLRQFLRARHELRRVARSPLRGGGALAFSVASWGGVWAVTVALLRAMDLQWGAWATLTGVLGAAVGSSLPVNALGNFGSLEAGWTAALSALGIPAAQALAAGFATHLWSAVFTALLGALGAAYLALCQAGILRSSARPTASSRPAAPDRV